MDWGLLEAASSAIVGSIHTDRYTRLDTNLTTNSTTRKSGSGTGALDSSSTGTRPRPTRNAQSRTTVY